jgi:hypothetical protein
MSKAEKFLKRTDFSNWRKGMTVHTQMERGEIKDLSMTSKILVIADASWQASLLIPGVFQMIQNHQTSVNAIFISCLLEPFKKNLGPNTLYFLVEEEKKALRKIKDYFAGMNIPYDLKVITASPLETVLNEVKCRDHGLIILQGEFIKIWEEDRGNHGPCSQAINRLNRPILVINKSNENSLSYPDFDSKIL